MNERCHLKDCKYRSICNAHRDLADCRTYDNRGKAPSCYVCVMPIDRQLALIPGGMTGGTH